MEFVISVLLIVTIVSNFAIIRSLKKLQSPPIFQEVQSTLEVAGCGCGEGLAEEIKAALLPLLEEKPVKPLPKPDESHFAWKNQKEEPRVAPPSPHGPPPVPGPLERPYGFSR